MELIYFLSLPLIPKISEPFELLIVLLSVAIFDAVIKDYISVMFVSFDEVILLELQCGVDSVTTEDLLCKLEMGYLIFLNNH